MPRWCWRWVSLLGASLWRIDAGSCTASAVHPDFQPDCVALSTPHACADRCQRLPTLSFTVQRRQLFIDLHPGLQLPVDRLGGPIPQQQRMQSPRFGYLAFGTAHRLLIDQPRLGTTCPVLYDQVPQLFRAL
ncbi:hypothetical protein [Synechococcus sp. MIT S9509]|uniref:hypothetical protein n=1 Tax=Synechococcus sp. MIT S9509 TaxID=1801630 RepID=UPI0012E796E5|nr:hypothetical protein [Synechococcus sp. MIT S9509]